MNVLSLCDGMSCGQIAFEKLGIKVNKYYASEIKPIAIEKTKLNFPKEIAKYLEVITILLPLQKV